MTIATGEQATAADAIKLGSGNVVIVGIGYSVINQGSWAYSPIANQVTDHWWTNTSANNGDEVDYIVYLLPGTYKISVLAVKDSSYGIMKIDIDGSTEHTVDLYNATSQSDRQSSTGGITVAAIGPHVISVKADGKNGSSSNYAVGFTYLVLTKTS